jgi:hypothetical protein
VEAQINWQAFTMATLVPPAQRIAYVETRRTERAASVEAAAVDCECPEFCRIDHEND